VLLAARQEQADYTMMDSLLNIGFGTVFGGCLHAIGGKIGDIVRSHNPETRASMLKAGIAQFEDGRQVDVGPVSKMADIVETHPIHNVEIPRGTVLDLPEPLIGVESRTIAEFQAELDNINLQVKAAENKVDLAASARRKVEAKKKVDILTERRTKISDEIDKTKKNIDKINDIDQKIKAEEAKRPTSKAGKEAKAKRIEKLKNQQAKLKESVGAKPDKTVAEAVREALSEPRSRSNFSEAEIEADIQATFKPEAETTYDPQAVKNVDDILEGREKIDFEESMQDVEAEIANLKKSNMLDEDDLAEFNEADEFIKSADKMEGYFDAIAVCVARS